jgi:hypothetical protein
MPYSALKVNRWFGGTCRWFLAWLILWPWWWRWHVPPKCWLTFNGLHGVISQKTELFITTAVRTSNPTSQLRFLRWLLGVTLRVEIKSAKIWEHLEVNSVLDNVQQYEKHCLEYVENISPKSLLWQTYSYKPIGRQEIGHPRSWWNSLFCLMLQLCGPIPDKKEIKKPNFGLCCPRW